MKKLNSKNKSIFIYNLIILLFILITDWSDWGGIIAVPILAFLLLILNLILNLILYRKEKDKGLKFFISYIITLFVGIGFFVLKAVIIDKMF